MKTINYIKDLNNNISGEVLEELGNSSNWLDKIFVAKHTNTTNKVLTMLSKENNGLIRMAVLKNENITLKILKEMLEIEKDETIIKEILKKMRIK